MSKTDSITTELKQAKVSESADKTLAKLRDETKLPTWKLVDAALAIAVPEWERHGITIPAAKGSK